MLSISKNQRDSDGIHQFLHFLRVISQLKSERNLNTKFLSYFCCYLILNLRVLPTLSKNHDARLQLLELHGQAH